MTAFNSLIGKTLVDVGGLYKGSEDAVFTCSDGDKFIMRHRQDCCESVQIEDVCGDVADILNTPIIEASERSNSDRNPDDDEHTTYEDSFTWAFYRIYTMKGTVVIRWYGSSNGYYGETPCFDKEGDF